jgi:hypothetical protein
VARFDDRHAWMNRAFAAETQLRNVSREREELLDQVAGLTQELAAERGRNVIETLHHISSVHTLEGGPECSSQDSPLSPSPEPPQSPATKAPPPSSPPPEAG